MSKQSFMNDFKPEEPQATVKPRLARGNSNVNVVIRQDNKNHYQRNLLLHDPPSINEFDLLTEIGEGMSATVRNRNGLSEPPPPELRIGWCLCASCMLLLIEFELC